MAVEINLRTVIVFTVFSAVKSTTLKDGHLLTPNVTGSMKGFHDLSRRVTYPEKKWRGGEETFIHNGYRGDPETRSLTKRSEVVRCISRFTRDSIYNNCIRPCSKINCINGKCDGRTECKCNDGYVKSQTNSFICHSKCRPCLPGECTKSQLCTCDKGYRLSSNQQTCEPICNAQRCNGELCVSPNVCYVDSPYYSKFVYGQYCSRECRFGECVGLDTCKCFNGYNKTKDGRCADPICNEGCGHGRCVGPNTCECFKGYNKTKDGQCFDPICNKGCGHGRCVGPNTCECFKGYNMTKDGRCFDPICNKGCGHGRCVGPNTCECFKGYNMTKDGRCFDPICNKGCGHGRCVGPNTCECFKGYNMTKDGRCFDPICNKGCGHGRCVGPNTCECFKGYNMTKDGRCFDPICNKGCGHGRCVGPNTCECLNGYNKTKDGQCTYPICKEECKYSSCTGPHICTCRLGYEKPFENSTRCVPRCTRCNNGICDGPEICRCHSGFVNPKSDNGTCVKCNSESNHDVGPEICRCHSGFVNPKSNKGTCAHNCSRGWTGESCEEPIMCVIALYTPHDSENSIREISESNCIDDETTNFQVDTELPRCHEKCFNELTIRSIANFTRSTANMTYYFVPITSACNEMRPSDTDWSQKSTTITVLILIPIILFATIFGFVTFVRRRRRNGGFNDAMPVYDDAGEVRLYEPLKRRFCSIFQLFL
ncbi:tenascin-like isoform X1 [Neodiprion lecontei]|uniref:Tenascin-like isoform X1 n=1 Tax=Neodiprion lecontei TaxID=441921 RepID=A0ABM3FYJ0_NEOLC|nr:tenascin-like isoform X1 [Neodiprion lecontei]